MLLSGALLALFMTGFWLYCLTDAILTPAADCRGLRKPARLRSAKLLDAAYRFVCEGRICDRSRDGLRLALARDIGLPPRLAVHIDETGEVRGARIVWRRGPTIGVRLDEAAPADALKASDRYALRRRYYAVPG